MELAWSFPRAPIMVFPIMVFGLITLVGAKYLGSICAGLASALSVVSGVLMSIPRNLVCWGEMDPGSTPPSVVTSVAGAPWEPAWFHELESDVEWGEFMIDSSFLHASDGCSLFLVIHSTDGFTLLCLWDSQCLYQSMTQLPKMQGTTLCCDLSQINMQTKWHGTHNLPNHLSLLNILTSSPFGLSFGVQICNLEFA